MNDNLAKEENTLYAGVFLQVDFLMVEARNDLKRESRHGV